MTLLEKQQRLIAELSFFTDPQERLSAIVDRSRNAPALSPELRLAAHRVPGCISVVWLVCELHEGQCRFRADAESPIVRSLVVLLANFFDRATPEEISTTTADPLEALDLTRNLSPTRRNGLAATRGAIQAFARQVAPASIAPRDPEV